MIALAISIMALLVSVAALFWALTDDWRCFRCGRYRHREADGWRHCESCGTGWMVEDA